MKQLRKGKTLKKSAAVADMDEKTARKYRDAGRPPSQARERRGYRTRADPFEGVWSEIRPLLENEPDVEASALLDWLCGKYPDRFRESHLRTLQRRIKGWRAVEGPAKEVYFEQQHVAGHQAQSDFTSFNDLNVTIGRQPFGHLYYHFCLTYSNWEPPIPSGIPPVWSVPLSSGASAIIASVVSIRWRSFVRRRTKATPNPIRDSI